MITGIATSARQGIPGRSGSWVAQRRGTPLWLCACLAVCVGTPTAVWAQVEISVVCEDTARVGGSFDVRLTADLPETIMLGWIVGNFRWDPEVFEFASVVGSDYVQTIRDVFDGEEYPADGPSGHADITTRHASSGDLRIYARNYNGMTGRFSVITISLRRVTSGFGRPFVGFVRDEIFSAQQGDVEPQDLDSLTTDGTDCPTVIESPDLPTGSGKGLSLERSFPNPFNTTTRMGFYLPRDARAELVVYDVRGQEVRPLVRGMRAQGAHEVIWDGTDTSGRAVATGVYFVVLSGAGDAVVQKITLLK